MTTSSGCSIGPVHVRAWECRVANFVLLSFRRVSLLTLDSNASRSGLLCASYLSVKVYQLSGFLDFNTETESTWERSE